jgi:tRNA (adenine37-N6)-methyltransferase
VRAENFSIKAVGRVRVDGDGTRLEIAKEWAPALEGLNGFSHLWVVFWCDRVDDAKLREQTACERPYAKGPERLGIWATRSPLRPNPIAITPVAITHVDVERGIVRLPFIDAEDGTPVLDLKPYHPAIDRVRDVATPGWCAHWPKWYEDSATFNWAAELNCP